MVHGTNDETTFLLQQFEGGGVTVATKLCPEVTVATCATGDRPAHSDVGICNHCMLASQRMTHFLTIS